jgi:hypothetical protein
MMQTTQVADTNPTATPQLPAYQSIVSDSVIGPKPFTGNSHEGAEEWFDYLGRYATYRNLREQDKLNLFQILLQGSAADWLSTLKPSEKSSYAALTTAFKDNYFKSPEFRWKEASQLWGSPQMLDERVDDFVTRLRKGAKRLAITDEFLHFAVINGLRPNLRSQVLQQGVKTLQDTIRAARIAEASASTDPITALLIENMKTTSHIAQQQADDLKELSAKVSALTVTQGCCAVQTHAQSTASEGVTHRTSPPMRQSPRPANRQPAFRNNQPRPQRQYKQTPQRLQRENYGRNALRRENDRSAQQQQHPQTAGPTNGTTCTRCGNSHAPGDCRAEGQLCYRCGKPGHYSRKCLSAQPARD